MIEEEYPTESIKKVRDSLHSMVREAHERRKLQQQQAAMAAQLAAAAPPADGEVQLNGNTVISR